MLHSDNDDLTYGVICLTEVYRSSIIDEEFEAANAFIQGFPDAIQRKTKQAYNAFIIFQPNLTVFR